MFARRGGATSIHLLPTERHDLLDDGLDGGGEVDGGVLGDVGPDLIIMMMMIIFKLINKVPTLTRHIHSCMRPTGRRRALRLDLD